MRSSIYRLIVPFLVREEGLGAPLSQLATTQGLEHTPLTGEHSFQ